MVEQVVAPLDLLGRGLRKVHAVRAARGAHLVVRAGEADEPWMHHRLFKVVLEALRRVARGVNGDEDGLDELTALVELLQHARHLCQLLRTDVRALGEAKVEQRPLALEVFARHAIAIPVDEREGPAEVGFTGNALCRHLPHPLVLVKAVERCQRRRCRNPSHRAAQPLTCDRGAARWLLRRPAHAASQNTATARAPARQRR